jgi:ATP-dependent helicase HepA
MSDPFIDLCLGIQGVRRAVEREAAGLGGATGIAAVPYPHQLANVHRVLTDSRIRHLIADEVGLGKTVQALMILNALRLQNSGHRALILVPENLAAQWLLECQSRGHISPLTGAPAGESGAYVRLAYYEQLGSISEIDPNLYDLLIVDEIQRVQSVVRQRIEDVGGEFRQLLLLSATPRLEDAEAFRQLLRILEPERMARAARTSEMPETYLHQIEKSAAELLAKSTPEQWEALGLGYPPERARPATVASTYCVLRRVTNTRRRDYPDLLPQRVLHRIAIEPTSDEVARQEKVWQYINYARSSDGSTDLARLGQVALRSPRALSERINVLRGRDQRDPEGFLQAATEHLDPANGDTRLEALIDVLVGIWNMDPHAAVLVVAEDNPTVDYLERLIPQFLPEIGPHEERRALSLAVKRNRDAAATEDLVELFDEYDESLGGFIEGRDQLLVAADIAQVGLNLQHARNIIFFSMPWAPAAVEQWIGRLDRLGSAALDDEPGARTIDIHAIYQRDQVDERVISVLEAFGVFQRSIRLDGDEINIVSQHIVDAALAPHAINWTGISREARKISSDDDASFATPLSAALPWQNEQARALAEKFDRKGSVGPMLEHSRARRAIVRVEAGLRGWIRLMGRANALRLWRGTDAERPDRHFRLLHYYRAPFSRGPIEPRFPLPDIEPSEGQRYAYLDDRRSLETPPVEAVNIDGNAYAPLRFLDHGNSVHEALITEWSKIGKSVPTSLKLRFPEGHLLARDAYKGTYLVSIQTWLPSALYMADFDRSVVLAGLQEGRPRLEQKPLFDAVQRIEEELRADRRWLNGLFTARLDILVARLRDQQWTIAEPAVAEALCVPWCIEARGKDVQLASSQPQPLTPEFKAARTAGLRLLGQEFAARHRRSLGESNDLSAEIAARRYLVAAEANDLVAWRQSLLDDATAQGMETSDQGFTRSRFKAISNARDMSILSRDIRLARLDGLFTELQQQKSSPYKLTILTVA